jgi:hypothetical protein
MGKYTIFDFSEHCGAPVKGTCVIFASQLTSALFHTGALADNRYHEVGDAGQHQVSYIRARHPKIVLVGILAKTFTY